MDIHSPFFLPPLYTRKESFPPLLPIDTTRTRPLASTAQLRTLLPRPKETPPIRPQLKQWYPAAVPPSTQPSQRPTRPPAPKLTVQTVQPGMWRTPFTEKGPRSVARPFHNSSSPPSSGAASHSPSNRTRYHRRMFPLHAKRKRPRDTATR